MGGDEIDVVGVGGGMLDGGGATVIFLVHFSSSFRKSVLVRVPKV